MDCPKRNTLAGLSDEAMLEILARTPFRSVCRSKCVAKAWRDLIDDPLNRRRLPQTLQGFFAIFDQTCNSDSSSDSDSDSSSDVQPREDPFFLKYLTSPDIEPCLSFLMELPETETINFEDCCNGLLLFEHCPKSDPHDVLSYIVCNPTTKHWANVPVCASCPPREKHSLTATYLIFDPARAASPHFHLIQFWRLGWSEEAPLTYEEIRMLEMSVHTYSSESGVWSHSQTNWNEQGQLEGWRHQGMLKIGCDQRTFVDGILHLIVFDSDQHQIIAIDAQGKTKRIITIPKATEGRQWCDTPFIGQSQGRLHYISQDCVLKDYDSRQEQSSELSIWELQDYDTQEWVLKDTVSFLSLLGSTTASRFDLHFVTIHPDRNVVFFVEENRLIAYDMDRKEVSVVCVLSERLNGEIVPYIPYLSESPALTNKD